MDAMRARSTWRISVGKGEEVRSGHLEGSDRGSEKKDKFDAEADA